MQLILSLFRLFSFTLNVSGPYWTIIRGVLSCYYATIWFLQCCCLFVPPWRWPCRTNSQQHCKNKMVA
jgi:hypothetical protein